MNQVLENLPFGLSPDDAFLLIAGAAALIVVVMIWAMLTPKSPTNRRIQMLTAHEASLRSAAASSRQHRNDRTILMMRRVVDRMKLARSRQADSVAIKLQRAGKRGGDALIVYLFAKATLPLAMAGGCIMALFVLDLYDLTQEKKLLVSVGATLLGMVGPDIYLRNLADKRRIKMRKGLPDALDLMVICAEAGLSLDATLNKVATEIAETYPELSDELGLTAVELGFLPERRTALTNVAERTNLPGIRAMMQSLLQTERYGTPLAQSLRVLSAELRNERMMKAEEKAARLPATLTVPMILFILPPLFIVLLGPAILDTIDAMRGLGFG